MLGFDVVVVLTNDTWDPTIGDDNQITRDLIAGLTSAQSEATGWNALIRDNLTFENVVLDIFDNEVTIFCFGGPGPCGDSHQLYNITSDEFITLSIPPSALVQSTTVLVATPTARISVFD